MLSDDSRGDRIRTRIDGFGDRSSTIELHPYSVVRHF